MPEALTARPDDDDARTIGGPLLQCFAITRGQGLACRANLEADPAVQLAQQAADGGIALIATALALGFRHGVDWDHIAAIADITGSAPNLPRTDSRAEQPLSGPRARASRSFVRLFGPVELHALGLACLYALGHALVVVTLGALALYFQAFLPAWIDPIMERVVGATLLVLGLWVFYSLVRFWRGDGEFQLRSRWMLVFAAVRHAWHLLWHRHLGHQHAEQPAAGGFGVRSAFGVGMIHGIGAETGTQVLIIAAIGGTGSQGLGTAMMLAFVVGLLISNGLIAVLAASGFTSSARARPFYIGVGITAGLFSVIVGSFFVLGLGDRLPDLQQLFGPVAGGDAP